MSKKILMLVGDYAEDYETMVPFQFLRVIVKSGVWHSGRFLC